MKTVLVGIAVLILSACNSTTSANHDTIALVNANDKNVIRYHKTDKECQLAKISQNISSKAQWASHSVATRSSHINALKLAQCEG